jgi:hypothetical protein
MTAGTGVIRLLALPAVLGLLSLLTACRSTGPAYVVGLHCFADHNLDPSRFIQTVWDPMQARKVKVYAHAFLSSRRFCAGEVLPAAEGQKCGLRLYIDPSGHNIWRQSIGEYRGSQFAVIVDGFYIGRSPFPTDFNVLTHVDLAPLWGRGEAERIIEQVEKNYLKLNRLD